MAYGGAAFDRSVSDRAGAMYRRDRVWGCWFGFGAEADHSGGYGYVVVGFGLETRSDCGECVEQAECA